MDIVKIKKEFQVPGTDIVLEEGDSIRILKEEQDITIEDLLQQLEDNFHAVKYVIITENSLRDLNQTKIMNPIIDLKQLQEGKYLLFDTKSTTSVYEIRQIENPKQLDINSVKFTMGGLSLLITFN